MPDLDPAVREYYERGRERDRLFGGFPSGPLELVRTQELISRHLPNRPLRVADVGGGPGAYASWLAGLGHQVSLVDPVELHVEQATEAGIDAAVGDARALLWAQGTFDVVLLLGPLYHLLRTEDRLKALQEAHRILKPDGHLFAAAISRFAALLDMLVRLDELHEDGVLDVVTHAVETGEFLGDARGLFTNAYFHHDDELLAEIKAAGFDDCRVFNIEGPGFLVSDFADRWADPRRREAMLTVARLTEREPRLIGASSHLLAHARRSANDASADGRIATAQVEEEGNGIVVREAEPGDAESVTALIDALGYSAEEASVRDRIEEFRTSTYDQVLVAEVAGEVQGFVVVSLTRRFVEPGWFSRITALAVSPDARRRGVGRALVSEAESIVVAEGSTLMQINCGRRRERDAAHRFYVQLGYRDQHDHHILYSKPLNQ